MVNAQQQKQKQEQKQQQKQLKNEKQNVKLDTSSRLIEAWGGRLRRDAIADRRNR